MKNVKKKIKTVIIWILISLTAQVAVLFYAENVVFADNGRDIKVNKVEEKKEEIADIALNIPDDAENINFSYNGKYIAYIKDGQIYVISTMDGTSNTIECDGKNPYYKWLDDRNRMIIAEQEGNGKITLSSYDVSRGEKEEYNELSTGSSNAKVVNIEASTLTQVTYVKVAYSQTKYSIYRIGINNDIKKVSVKTSKIGTYKTLNREDVILYQDSASGNIYSSSKENLNTNNEGKADILGIDSEDNIYIGYEDSDGRIKSVRYGSKDIPVSSWSVCKLDDAAALKDIYISKDGAIFVNDNLKGIITNIKDNSQKSYEGMFLGFYNNGAASINEGNLSHVTLD